MESFPLTLGLVLLSFWCVGAVPTPNGTIPFAIQPKNDVDAQSTETLYPRFFDSFGDKLMDSKHGILNYLRPGQTVTIQSPNYPDPYPSFNFKKWIFWGTSLSSTISITCTDFRLNGCWYSCLIINGHNLFNRYCNTQSAFTATSGNRYLSVLFYSAMRSNDGFQCTVSASGGTTTTSSTSTSTSTSIPSSTSTITSIPSSAPISTFIPIPTSNQIRPSSPASTITTAQP